MDRGAWRATGRRVLKDSDTTLSTLALHREDTHPYLESRRGRSRMDAQVRTGDYGWTTLGLGTRCWGEGSGLKSWRNLLQATLQFQFYWQ